MALKLFEAFVEIRGKLEPLERSLRLAKTAVSGAIRAMNKMFSAVYNTAAKAFKRVALAITGIYAASIKAFSSFEAQLANVATMLTKLSMKFLPQFQKGLQKLAVQFGESTDTLATGLYNILSASIAPAKAMEVLEIATRAAAAGMTDTSTAAYAITGILNAYGMSADNAANVSDILFAAIFKGQTTFRELSSAIGRVNAIAASAGISFEEVAAAMATITRGGISTAEAVTNLRGVISALQGKTKEGVKIAADYGIELSVTALESKKLSGMLRELSGLSATTIKEIFTEMEARTGLNTLLKDQVGFLEDYELAMNAAGMTQEAYAKQAELLARKFRSLWEAVKMTGVTIGTAFEEQTKTSLDAMTAWIVNAQDRIAEWSERVAAAVSYVKNVLFGLLGSLKGDWLNKLKTILAATIPMWAGMADAIGDIFKNMWDRVAGYAITSGQRALAKWTDYQIQLEKMLTWKEYFDVRLEGKTSPEIEAKKKRARGLIATHEALGGYEEEFPGAPTAPIGGVVKKALAKMSAGIDRTLAILAKEAPEAYDIITDLNKTYLAKTLEIEKKYQNLKRDDAKTMMAGGGGGGGIGGVPGLPGAGPTAGAGGAARKFGFAGIEEIWKGIVSQIAVGKDPIVIATEENTNELQRISKLQEVGVGVNNQMLAEMHKMNDRQFMLLEEARESNVRLASVGAVTG